LTVKNLPSSPIELPNHPTNDLGKRKVELDEILYLDSADVQGINAGDHLRLMGLGNVRIDKVEPNLVGDYVGDDVKVDYPKIQWVTKKNSQKLKIIIPKELFIDEEFNEKSLEELEVFTEPYYLELSENAEIQFVRFGYCRKESAHQAIFSHK